jgi:hypothetical protein
MFGRFIPEERAPSTRWIGDWVNPRADLDPVVKTTTSCLCLKSDHDSPVFQGSLTITVTELSRLLHYDYSPPFFTHCSLSPSYESEVNSQTMNTAGRNSWMGHQPIAWPLQTRVNANIEQVHTYIHAKWDSNS